MRRLDGNRSSRWRGGYVTTNGYKKINVDVGGKYRSEHVVVVERVLGRPLREGEEVHHVNEDKTDNSNANLVVLQSSADHVELHRKLRVLRAGGDPWKDRLCYTCGPQPSSEFYCHASRRTACGVEWSGQCKVCARRSALERHRAAS